MPEFLATARPDDRLIVFYSGHGIVKDGKAYLIPSDLKRKDIPDTGFPIQELRSALANCQAKTKFLILDCCQAGGADRAVEDDEARPEVLAKSLEPGKLAGTVVLASCNEKEKSWEWPARQQGIFTYWLCRGLEGGADANGDGQLSFEEVYQYTYDRVKETALQVTGNSQTPVRLVAGDVEGTPTLLTLRPEPPDSLCRRLSEQLDVEVRRQKLKKVGVLEFAVPLAKVEGLARANLPGYCAERIRKALAQLAGDAYQVLTTEQMNSASKGVRVEDLGDPAAMQQMNQRAGGIDAVVTGTIKRRGAKLHVQCDLVATANGNSLVTPTGVLPLNEELVADNGASFDNRDRPPGSPYAPEVVDHARRQAQQVHPLMIKDFPFKIEIESFHGNASDNLDDPSRWKKKEFENVTLPGGGDTRSEMMIGAHAGEIVRVRVRNEGATKVAMILLVDGVNTVDGRRELLGHARPWLLKPVQPGEPGGVIEGWTVEDKSAASAAGTAKFKLNRFQFHDLAPVAGREKFGDAPGIITAAFYAEAGRGVELGKLDRDEVRHLQVEDFKVGRLLGVVQIRYVDEKDLKKRD